MLGIISRNVACNWLGFAVQAATTFVLTPFVLRKLGESQYGLWALIMGLTGYYGLVDLGLRGGATQYITRYLAQRDYTRLNQSFSSALAALSGIAFVVAGFSVLLGWVVPHVVRLPEGVTVNEAWLCILLVGLGMASQFIFFPYSALFAATQRYDLTNAIAIVMRILTAWAMYQRLAQGGGLLSLCIINAISNFLEYAIRCVVGQWLVPEIRVSISHIHRERMMEFISYGLWNSLLSLSHALRNGTDLFIITLLAGEAGAAVARYTLAARVVKYITDLMTSMSQVFFPTATAMHATGDQKGMLQLWTNGSRAILLALFSFSIIAWQWSDDFYRLWIGHTQPTAELPSVPPLFRLLLLVTVAAFVSGVGRQILLGCKLIQISSMLALSEAVGNFVLSVVLGYFYGVWGVAVGTLIPVVIVRVWIEPAFVAKQLNASLWTYWRQSATRPLLMAIALFLATNALRQCMPPIDHYWQLFAHGAIAASIALTLVGLVGLESGERTHILQSLARRAAFSR